MTSIFTNGGRKVCNNRFYKVTPDYTAPSILRFGQDQTTPTVTTTGLIKPIPVLNGTVNDDGQQTLTGSGGGDNSTNNTTTYKPGAGVTDNTAQNLIKNTTNATATWTIADLSSAGNNCVSTKFTGLWIYIKDATALAKFLTAGTCLEIRIGVDITTNYYSYELEASDLAVGWNWLYNGLLSAWTSNGTPGTLNDLGIIATTNNATDEFVAGDLVYDLLRQWEDTDVKKSFSSGFPSLNESTLQVNIQGELTSTQGNGFNLNATSIENTDGTPIVTDVDTYTADGKADTDEFKYEYINGWS